ncbi:MAG: lactate utilization protein [Magnetovibrio sp.]|nr:lactate utilization protein [Magnetovibrio sp.]
MTLPRDQILGRLKSALDRENRPPEAARARLRDRPAGLIPERGQGAPADRLALFAAEAERVEATVARIPGPAALPREVARYLAETNQPPALRAAQSLADVDWSSQPMLKVTGGTADGADNCSISRAFGGVAETGTLVFLSGPDNPTTLNFVPPTHIAVIRAADIAGDYEAVWARLRAEAGGGAYMPRTVNWVTGPSRTADIEQTLLLGAHGPQRLHIVILDDDATP